MFRCGTPQRLRGKQVQCLRGPAAVSTEPRLQGHWASAREGKRKR